jgi:glycosyltransferase involved in cell wall biosynthesis
MITRVDVVVPAANEGALIGACLDALAAARDHAHDHLDRPIAIGIVVVLDSCVDSTERTVRSRPEVDAVVCRVRQVGAARSLGAQRVLDRVPGPLAQTWIANTDADSRVPSDWITTMLRHADRGAQLVLGTVLPDMSPTSTTYRRWRGRHMLCDGHPHVHGANLGVRADAYVELGGWPSLATGEDVALVQRAERLERRGELSIVRTAGIPVVTSARTEGRATHGFAGYLQRLAHGTRQLEPMRWAAGPGVDR